MGVRHSLVLAACCAAASGSYHRRTRAPHASLLAADTYGRPNFNTNLESLSSKHSDSGAAKASSSSSSKASDSVPAWVDEHVKVDLEHMLGREPTPEEFAAAKAKEAEFLHPKGAASQEATPKGNPDREQGTDPVQDPGDRESRRSRSSSCSLWR